MEQKSLIVTKEDISLEVEAAIDTIFYEELEDILPKLRAE